MCIYKCMVWVNCLLNTNYHNLFLFSLTRNRKNVSFNFLKYQNNDRHEIKCQNNTTQRELPNVSGKKHPSRITRPSILWTIHNSIGPQHMPTNRWDSFFEPRCLSGREGIVPCPATNSISPPRASVVTPDVPVRRINNAIVVSRIKSV